MRGLDRFREHFTAHDGRYVLIGGAAADILMNEAGLRFRATRDLDIVLVAEALDAEFVRTVWDFVELGGYTSRQKSTGAHRFYRFHSPRDPGFPTMVELFTRALDGIELVDKAHLTPLPISEDVASLSAILLDDGYYCFVLEGIRRVDGIALLDAEHLIPMKARAWIDLTARRDAGELIDDRDIKKHRNDVVRLSQLLPGSAIVKLPGPLMVDMRNFLDEAFTDAPDPRQLGVHGVTLAEVERGLREVYGVEI